MEIDDDCIPFKKEKIFSKMSWVKKRPTHFLHLQKELTKNKCSVIIVITNLQVIELERGSIMGGLRTLVF